MKIKKYPDGTSYVALDVETGTSKPEFTFRINTYEDLWHLNQLVEVVNANGGKPIITIPNLIDAQADRRFASNQSSGLKLVCEFLGRMKAEFKIFHPHNPEVVEAMMFNVEIIDNSKFIELVLHNLALVKDLNRYKTYIDRATQRDILKDTILMSSDAGGFKPLMKLCDQINWKGETYSASKARTNTGLKQLIDRKDFNGKDILIIDDICVYGGTFKGLSKLLKEKNCGKLYLVVSHMTIQNLSEDPVTNYFDKVFTTNSKFDEYNWGKAVGNSNPKNLEIIKLF